MALLGRLIPTTHALLWTESLACIACGEHREKPTVSSYSEAQTNFRFGPANWGLYASTFQRRAFAPQDSRVDGCESFARRNCAQAGRKHCRTPGGFFAEVWNILGVSRVHPPVPTPLEETS
jgi:hypothetical protein